MSLNLNRVFMPHAEDLKKSPSWKVIDAAGKIVGRLATEIAKELCGKNSPLFTPHMKMGSYIIVINAEKVIFSDVDKMRQKTYRKHTGYTGHDSEFTAAEAMKKDPTFVLEAAVKRMLPKSKLGNQLFKERLKIYAGNKHPHQAQITKIV
jgi:large subunit ribosomal protein L13